MRRTRLFLDLFDPIPPTRPLGQLIGHRRQGFPSVDLTPAPAQHGLLGWAYDPAAAVNNSAAPAGQVLLVRISAAVTGIVGTVTFGVANTPAGVTTAFVGLYDAAGLLIGGSANQAELLNSTSQRTFSPPLMVPPAVQAGSTIYAAFLTSTATTLPNLLRGSSSASIINNADTPRVLTYGSGLTALPASINLASAASNGVAYYASLGK